MSKLRQSLALLDKECESLEADLINPEIQDKTMLAKALDGNTADWLTKMKNIGILLEWWGKEKDFIRRQIVALKEHLDNMEEREDWLRDYTVESMVKRNEKSLKFPEITMYWQPNEPSIEIVEQKDIPDIFQKLVPAHYDVDKKLITQHFKQTGELVPGVKVITDKKHLVVR